MYAATAAARARDAAKPKYVLISINLSRYRYLIFRPTKVSPLTAILPICCLLLIAFFTAVMIVLALIPLYLPHKDVTPCK